MTQFVLPVMTGSAPVPYEATVTGRSCVPLASRSSGPVHVDPLASSTRSPGAGLAAASLLSVRQAVEGDVPALLSLPRTASR